MNGDHMNVKAQAKYIRHPATQGAAVLDLVRGLPVEQAQACCR